MMTSNQHSWSEQDCQFEVKGAKNTSSFFYGPQVGTYQGTITIPKADIRQPRRQAQFPSGHFVISKNFLCGKKISALQNFLSCPIRETFRTKVRKNFGEKKNWRKVKETKNHEIYFFPEKPEKQKNWPKSKMKHEFHFSYIKNFTAKK